ncbi:hypothetical protein E2C01_082408 [Portunus trituberculatus]|uniref:Uncharacterized protein n=1 Tax=Portunus trituberculatus TaxID=210409 RepID=A0A5B7IZ63_PORTR|nr:hypothetical protein [Portunus trituberculatus]
MKTPCGDKMRIYYWLLKVTPWRPAGVGREGGGGGRGGGGWLERLGSDLELGPSSLSVAESAQCWPLITTDKHWGGLARAY